MTTQVVPLPPSPVPRARTPLGRVTWVVLLVGVVMVLGGLVAVGVSPGWPPAQDLSVAEFHAGDTARIQGTLVGTPGQDLFSAVPVSCASALRTVHALGTGPVCWDWTVGWFAVEQNGTIVQVDGTHLDQFVLGAPHDVGSGDNETLEYLAGDPVAVYGTVGGSPGNWTLRASVVAPSVADIPFTTTAYVDESAGLFFGGLVVLAVGALLAARDVRARRRTVSADRNGAVRI